MPIMSWVACNPVKMAAESSASNWQWTSTYGGGMEELLRSSQSGWRKYSCQNSRLGHGSIAIRVHFSVWRAYEL